MVKSNLGRPKDENDLIKLSIIDKFGKSKNFSIRLKDGLSIEQVNQEINNFVYKILKE